MRVHITWHAERVAPDVLRLGHIDEPTTLPPGCSLSSGGAASYDSALIPIFEAIGPQLAALVGLEDGRHFMSPQFARSSTVGTVRNWHTDYSNNPNGRPPYMVVCVIGDLRNVPGTEFLRPDGTVYQAERGDILLVPITLQHRSPNYDGARLLIRWDVTTVPELPAE